jgi:hypothetical protein
MEAAAEDATSDEPVEEEAQLAARREENIRALLSNKYATLQPCILLTCRVHAQQRQQLCGTAAVL